MRLNFGMSFGHGRWRPRGPAASSARLNALPISSAVQVRNRVSKEQTRVLTILLGVGICLPGIGLPGMAGYPKKRDVRPAEAPPPHQRSSNNSCKKGLLGGLRFPGVMSCLVSPYGGWLPGDPGQRTHIFISPRPRRPRGRDFPVCGSPWFFLGGFFFTTNIVLGA